MQASGPPWEQERSTKLYWMAMGAAAILPVLAFVLTGLFRIVGRKTPVGLSLRALALVAWSWVALQLVLHAASYVTRVAFYSGLSTLLTNAGVVATFAFLATVGRRGPLRRFVLVWIGALCLLMLGLEGAARLAQRQTGTPQVDYAVSVPIAGVSGPTGDLEGYLDGLRTDFAVAERRAAENAARSRRTR